MWIAINLNPFTLVCITSGRATSWDYFAIPEETKRISVTSCFVRVVAVWQCLLSASLSWIPWKKNDLVIRKFRNATREFQFSLVIGAYLQW